LDADKSAWCGAFSFFSKSYVRDTMTLDELIKHAYGQSKKGSGARSNAVMQELGWLNANNELSVEVIRINTLGY
jgi:hypothetical protein